MCILDEILQLSIFLFKSISYDKNHRTTLLTLCHISNFKVTVMYTNYLALRNKSLLKFILATTVVAGVIFPAQAQFAQPSSTESVGSSLEVAGALTATENKYRPLWFNTRHKPKPLAKQAVKMLLAAEQEGLVPQDYRAQVWQQKIQLAQQQKLPDLETNEIDKGLTEAVVLYLNNLNHGRINPKTIRERYESDNRADFDASQALVKAIANGDLQQAKQAAMPKVPMYAQLRNQLQLYLKLRQHPAWQEKLPTLPKKRVVRVGQSWQGLPVVRARLVAMGDMEQTELSDAEHMTEQDNFQNQNITFDAALQAGITSFQKRHRLRANGRLNRTTVKKLNRSPQDIAEHIANTMERLRWTPLGHDDRMIVVNIPEYRLRAYSLKDGQVLHVLPINVIVGKANRHRTPLFSKNMSRIEFSHYWNVPYSILRREMMSKINSDPSYIRRNNYEVVGAGGATNAVTPELLEALRTGRARVRQRPGRGNAMGGIKFVFPNRDNIYLHYTSSPRLFRRSYRALSHGCIRVQDPVDLAHYILENEDGWSKDRIRKLMRRGRMRVVQLNTPIPVILTYLTAFIHETGKLYFVPDVYGQDKRLRKALAAR